MKSEQIRPGVLCRHFKGKLYQIIGKAKDTETSESVVVYQALYGKYQLFVRPVSSFVSKVDRKKYPKCKQEDRFELVERKNLRVETDDKEKGKIETESKILEMNIAEEIQYEKQEENQDERINPHLLAFLEAETYEEKLAVLTAARADMDDKLLNGMAISLDVVIPEGEIRDRFIGFKNCLETFRKYEGNRFSR
ncbi:DUF1653 domain-containing protein [Anaerosacchariphilus polymeriproducens]|nr:DUF1653 domain-containing protein [Anaerosacchariphilus polymeriproducens]